MKKLELQNDLKAVQMDLKDELAQRNSERKELEAAHNEADPEGKKAFGETTTGKQFMKNYTRLKDAVDGLDNVLLDLGKYDGSLKVEYPKQKN